MSTTACAVDLVDSRTIPVGKNPNRVLVSDLNNDGKNDIIVSNQTDGTVSVIHNIDGKVFSDEKGFNVGQNPTELAIEDFNNDGFDDLVVANHETKSFHILLNDRRGGFEEKTKLEILVGSDPHIHTLGIGDFNRDNILDVVVDSWGNNRLLVYLGKGDLSFQTAPISIPVNEQPRTNLVVADLNNDQSPDIVTPAWQNRSISVVLGNNLTSTLDIETAPSPFFVEVADANLDGNSDIIVVHRDGNYRNERYDALSLLLGDGSGQFSPATGFPMKIDGAPSSVAIGDIDGDKLPEIVTANYRNNNITVLSIDHENGTVTKENFPAGERPEGITIADTTGDGIGEVLVTNRESNNIKIFYFAKSD